ncbi:MAG: VWA domain-containing protein [Caulobacteraceae bacterium]
MQETLEALLKALRANEVTVSPAEAIDAHRAAAAVGYADRALLKDALCVTLAKSGEEVDRFEACFDAFFRRQEFIGRPGRPSGVFATGADLETLLVAGESASLAASMEAAAAEAGASDIRLSSQRNLLIRRILDGMGLRELEQRINALGAGDAEERKLAAELQERRAELFEEAGRFVDRQARLYAGESGRRLRDRILEREKLTDVKAEDFRAMEALVRRMAKRLASRYARKRHRAKKGRLDVRKTVRKSMGHDGVPFEVIWKRETIEKPKIIAICDVSRSVAAAAQFLLLFLYSLHEVVERLDGFAFSDRLVRVNDLLADETVDDAITLILARIGFRPTDYGRALADFWATEEARLDRRTTVIILGDGRANYADPRLDLMRRINERARAVIWLNPEPETYWGQGDSRMDAYRRFCHLAKSCNTLRQLENIIDQVLSTYLPK